MKRKHETSAMSHILDGYMNLGNVDRTFSDIDNLTHPQHYSKSIKNKHNKLTKCMIINNELYCEEVED